MKNEMRKFMCMLFFGVIAVALMECTAAEVHVVGDNTGWTIPKRGGDRNYYETWAASRKFVVGDVLTFQFVKNQHNVLQVPKASYDECSSSNPIGNLITNGPADVTLNSPGQHYFICTVGQHCQAGMKLAIEVSAAPGASPPSPGGNPTPPPTTPGCTPAPTLGPTGTNPPSDNPSDAPQSSSSVVLASVLVSMLAIVMHPLFFENFLEDYSLLH